jgi:hypothetical protein
MGKWYVDKTIENILSKTKTKTKKKTKNKPKTQQQQQKPNVPKIRNRARKLPLYINYEYNIEDNMF